MPIFEDLRYLHEDIERLERGIADRIIDEPKHIRQRLVRDHEVANFLDRIQNQSTKALDIYNNKREERLQEVQSLSTGDPFEEFYKQLASIKDFHKRYPNEPVENLERAYKKTDEVNTFAADIDGMFTGEEGFGRYFDLTMLHEEYLNLPGVKGVRKLTYLQYLDMFDQFTPPQCTIKKQDKMTDQYFSYVGTLSQYLESFMRRTKPLEDLDRLFKTFDQEFVLLWDQDKFPGWSSSSTQTNGNSALAGPATEGTGEGVWCADCQKEFKNDNVYKAHLTGKKHIKNAEARQQNGDSAPTTASTQPTAKRTQERAIAEREHRIRKLTSAMKTEREDTRVNVERKQGMTDRERQQELAALYAEDQSVVSSGKGRNGRGDDDDEEADGEEKGYNPLKLPLAWDGKPIPFWLYKLHGLGVEFPCEICGNYVYMGRRAFEKHFSEQRHIYGLKCLGITNTSLFREITGIEEAERLWEKIQRDRVQEKEKRGGGDAMEEMEDSQGNVMPKVVWNDLKNAGLL
ncbi:splicesome-associated protein [Teratosphaeria nubilosa]|uniref:Splicesome-associated protein n=1 Tax=Teratosphaeria nubilosa TaxID=161662 RepID=A0A6G1LBB1_9PEZI|nr:splicesome-associated protein [Teratosphaeria nubilosa]